MTSLATLDQQIVNAANIVQSDFLSKPVFLEPLCVRIWSSNRRLGLGEFLREVVQTAVYFRHTPGLVRPSGWHLVTAKTITYQLDSVKSVRRRMLDRLTEGLRLSGLANQRRTRGGKP